VDESTTVSQFGDLSAGDFLTDHIVISDTPVTTSDGMVIASDEAMTE